MIKLTLGEKIASLPPNHQEEVEDFVEFLMSKYNISANNPQNESIKSRPLLKSRRGAPWTGVILAEEVPEKHEDRIDFADINARFGQHDSNDQVEHTEPRRGDRNLDWL